MNEHKEQTGFYLVLPSTSSDEIFLENHAGRFTVLLPKEIHLDVEFHWEMALVELFWPKQDSFSVRENLWYEIQESKRKWKRTHIPTSLFYSVSSLLDYVRQGFKETFDIAYDEYEQKVIWKLKENASGVFKIRLSNVLARSLGFNMSLPFTKTPISAKVDRHWEKTAGAESNHPKHYIEIAFSSSQQLVSNETPEDHYVPSFFHVQCNIESPVLINDTFLNCLATIQLTKNERYKYLRHYVPKHILYIPVRVASLREIHFRFTNQLNQTLMFSDSSSVIVLYIRPVL